VGAMNLEGGSDPLPPSPLQGEESTGRRTAFLVPTTAGDPLPLKGGGWEGVDRAPKPNG
jgi:hypothetical protein